MTNAPDIDPDGLEPTDSTIELDPDFDAEHFALADELEETSAWDSEDDPEDGLPDVEASVGAMDLADRHALRRVAGLSTELEDITEVEYRQLRLERVVLVGVWTSGTLVEAQNSLVELARLAETAGSQVLEALIQRRDRPDPATYIGSGKAKELRDIVVLEGADTVICDGELTPGQLRQLEAVTKVKVVDRTALILDIFAQHARSKEGKAQVELAAVPARRRSKSIGVGSTPEWRSCGANWPP
jgi:GTPase